MPTGMQTFTVQKTITSFWSRVNKTDKCWLWTGGRGKEGYASFRSDGRDMYGHQFSFMLHTGAWCPEGLELDHVCRVRHCVNPAHLEPVTHHENLLRGSVKKKYCHRGHVLADPNYYYYAMKNGTTKKKCKACMKRANRRSKVTHAPIERRT